MGGFENPNAGLSGGIAVTGNYPGKARTPNEWRADLDKTYSMIPVNHRVNLHSIYGDSDKKMDRNDWQSQHFDRWIEGAKENNQGIDFNPTCFSHPMAENGFTLASLDASERVFWVQHCINSREIGGYRQAVG